MIEREAQNGWFTYVIEGLLHVGEEMVRVFAEEVVMPKQKVKLGKINF